ncbi:uncharacterized protein [Parasteatoda tepidariorum]|uniref:uncharacterized protein isoform X3 n=1 Tax=Parasteatoda tepidariorum TaxID=114398 RepID=UPI00077FC438|nr:uncharacterized protein LOC107450792 isoform X3 [Parasteatoda tepidariorum]
MNMENSFLNKNLLRPLEDQLRCRICSEFYSNCVMAVCSHNFCSVCIKKRLTTEEDCPCCFEIIQESDLRSNRILDRLVRLYKKLQRDSNNRNTEAQNHSISYSQAQSNSHNPMESDIQMTSVQSSVQCTDILPSNAPCQNSPLIQSIHSQLTDLDYPVKLEIVDCNESSTNDVVMSTNSAEDSIGSDKSDFTEIKRPRENYKQNSKNEMNNHLEKTTNNQIPRANSRISSAAVSWQKMAMPAVSWQRMPPHLLQTLNENKEPLPHHYREMIRIIADDILSFTTNPKKALVKSVAKMCVEKFPILRDNFQNFTIGSGYDHLTNRVISRIENLRRKFSISKTLVDDPKLHSNKKRKQCYDSYGCVAWSPSIPLDETIESLESKKRLLKNCHPNSEMSITLMNQTYYLQRKEINEGAKISDLLIEWPLLFHSTFMLQHFETLTDKNIIEKLGSTIDSKGKDFITFFLACEEKEVKSLIIQNNGKNIVLLILFGIAKYFNEDISILVKMSEVLNQHDVVEIDIPGHPCLVGIGVFWK